MGCVDLADSCESVDGVVGMIVAETFHWGRVSLSSMLVGLICSLVLATNRVPDLVDGRGGAEDDGVVAAVLDD